MKRKNRLWQPGNRGVQATMCMCEKCGEAYEADREHVCGKINSYPVREDTGFSARRANGGMTMPMEIERYPTNWKAIANTVKETAGWKCQMCSKQCRKPGEPFDTHKRTLTVAHLNHIPEDVRPENLMAMCAPCHLRYDAQHHAETRRNKREG